jgi:hypothetical protein
VARFAFCETLELARAAAALTPGEIHARLVERLGESAPSYYTVWRWFRTDDEGRRPALAHYLALHEILQLPGDARQAWFDNMHPVEPSVSETAPEAA